jgi:hypothetical protein
MGNPENHFGMQKLAEIFSVQRLWKTSPKIPGVSASIIRAARRQRYKLAAIRSVWDKWVYRLPLFYIPGPDDVTVDEQLMTFRGRCPFRQCIPYKLAKNGIKIWAACDSSYA